MDSSLLFNQPTIACYCLNQVALFQVLFCGFTFIWKLLAPSCFNSCHNSSTFTAFFKISLNQSLYLVLWPNVIVNVCGISNRSELYSLPLYFLEIPFVKYCQFYFVQYFLPYTKDLDVRDLIVHSGLPDIVDKACTNRCRHRLWPNTVAIHPSGRLTPLDCGCHCL